MTSVIDNDEIIFDYLKKHDFRGFSTKTITRTGSRAYPEFISFFTPAFTMRSELLIPQLFFFDLDCLEIKITSEYVALEMTSDAVEFTKCVMEEHNIHHYLKEVRFYKSGDTMIDTHHMKTGDHARYYKKEFSNVEMPSTDYMKWFIKTVPDCHRLIKGLPSLY